jgi:L-threonylcarbamoyladenylate synthase
MEASGVQLLKTTLLEPSFEGIQQAALAIQRDELVAMPTETVYGLAGNAASAKAIASVFEAKERPHFDPLIVHVSTQAQTCAKLEALKLIETKGMNPRLLEKIDDLLAHFWPGPLTLLFPKHPEVSDCITSGLPQIAIRMPQHPVAQALLERSGCSLVAPSANRFGRISPTSPEAVFSELDGRIPWILNAGPCAIGIESTILCFTEKGPQVLRPGGTSVEALQAFLQETILVSQGSHQAPGMLPGHYAPRKPFYLLPETLENLSQETFSSWAKPLQLGQVSSLGLLLLQGDAMHLGTRFRELTKIPVIAKSLSLSGDLSETAKNLFQSMRDLDHCSCELIFSEPCLHSQGLGFAIADRLQRASHA